MRLGFDFSTALRAEFDLLRQRRVAVRAGGAHSLPPGFLLEHLAVFLGDFGMRPNLLHGAAGLGGSHLYPHIGRTFLAKTFLGVPATLATYPRRAARALDELGTNLFGGFQKSLVVGFLPGGGAGALAEIGSVPKDASKQAACRIQCVGDRAQCEGLKLCAVACAAAVAVELKLKAMFGALIRVIAGELDFLSHS